MPTRGASAGQLSRRRGSRRATVPGMEPSPPTADEREPGPETPDLVSIALAVFFVSVILVVGALLLVPAAF
jgi:hypothetical protein